MLARRPGVATALTEGSGGKYVIEARPFGWRLIPAPGSGYPAVRALTPARLLRRLAAAATPRNRSEL